MGEPGTSKSETARYYAKFLAKLKLIRKQANFLSCSVADVHGQYVGQTAAKTRQKIQQSIDGVLFLDEAYAMVAGANASGREVNYGGEFNGVLVEQMSRYSVLFSVVAAGYEHEMKTVFLASNPGYSRRFRTQLVLAPTFDMLVNATARLLSRQCNELTGFRRAAKNTRVHRHGALKRESQCIEGHR